MDGKKVLMLAIGILAGLYVVSQVESYSDLKFKFVKPSPDTFDPVGDDGVDALAIAGIATLVVTKVLT